MSYESRTQLAAEYVLDVPELKERPVIGGCCGAVSADLLIEETLGELDAVESVSVSVGEGVAKVWATSASDELLRELAARIEALGYPVQGGAIAL